MGGVAAPVARACRRFDAANGGMTHSNAMTLQPRLAPPYTERPHCTGGVSRRRWLAGAAACGAAGLTAGQARSAAPATTLQAAVLATPGPGSSVSAMAELAVRIGADQAEGLTLRLKFTGGGGIAIRELLSGNADFGIFGITAAMNENQQGRDLVALAAIEDQVPLTVMVRSDLKAQVRQVSDLAGRVVGIHSNSPSTLTNSQQLLSLLLRRAGVPAEALRVVAAGQSWDTQSSALRSRLVDAVVTEEPFGMRLAREGLAVPLVRLGLPGAPVGLPGEGLLRGTLICQRSLATQQPALAERMVRTLLRALAWRRSHSADELVAMLGLTGAEAEAFAAMLKTYPQQFSENGRFSPAQIAQTDTFYRESRGPGAGPAYPMASMLIDRWVGRQP